MSIMFLRMIVLTPSYLFLIVEIDEACLKQNSHFALFERVVWQITFTQHIFFNISKVTWNLSLTFNNFLFSRNICMKFLSLCLTTLLEQRLINDLKLIDLYFSVFRVYVFGTKIKIFLWIYTYIFLYFSTNTTFLGFIYTISF